MYSKLPFEFKASFFFRFMICNVTVPNKKISLSFVALILNDMDKHHSIILK